MASLVTLERLLVWSATFAMILSFSFAAFLCARCMLYLRRTRRKIGRQRELVKHIAAIAGADASMAAWSYTGSLLHNHSFFVRGDPSWCRLFTTVRIWLISLSALWTASLALAALAALRGRDTRARKLAWSSLAVVPLSVAMCAHNLWLPVYLMTSYDGSLDCEQSPTANMIECAEQALVQLFILAVLVYTMCRARALESTSAERRPMLTISRYFVAYTASYSLWIVARVPWASQWAADSQAWRLFVSVAWRLLCLNGAFNFAALWLHAREAAPGVNDAPRHAGFLDEPLVETLEVDRVDHQRLCRRNKAEVAQVQSANQSLWRELGLTYEQGVAGQLEPLSEEERASHLYAILDVGGASRLQQARVT